MGESLTDALERFVEELGAVDEPRAALLQRVLLASANAITDGRSLKALQRALRELESGVGVAGAAPLVGPVIDRAESRRDLKNEIARTITQGATVTLVAARLALIASVRASTGHLATDAERCGPDDGYRLVEAALRRCTDRGRPHLTTDGKIANEERAAEYLIEAGLRALGVDEAEVRAHFEAERKRRQRGRGRRSGGNGGHRRDVHGTAK